jgi:hypothetical protein
MRPSTAAVAGAGRRWWLLLLLVPFLLLGLVLSLSDVLYL